MKTMQGVANQYVENNIGYDNEEDKQLFIDVFMTGVRLGQQRLADELAGLFSELKSTKCLEEAFREAVIKNKLA